MSRPWFRPARARIDLAALRHNHAVARRHAGGSRIWSVLKADAYGHGLLRAARALEGVTDGIALVEIEGAVALRDAGFRLPLLMLEGCYAPDELPLYAEYELTPVLHSAHQIDWLENAALPTRLPVYVKLNTGMNRLGFNADVLPGIIERLQRMPVVASIALITHFADADEERGIAEQLGHFAAMRGAADFPVSLANSAALLRFPEALGDWVRPGIMLYGSSPFPAVQSAEALGLKPVMTLESELIAVRDLAPGDRVGYGGTFVADGPMRVGVVACGYADGYPRHAPTGTPALVDGKRTRTLGRVSMDKLCVDVTGIERAAPGAKVTLWGEGLPADEVAMSAGTIAYELFCALAGRVAVIEQDVG